MLAAVIFQAWHINIFTSLSIHEHISIHKIQPPSASISTSYILDLFCSLESYSKCNTITLSLVSFCPWAYLYTKYNHPVAAFLLAIYWTCFAQSHIPSITPLLSLDSSYPRVSIHKTQQPSSITLLARAERILATISRLKKNQIYAFRLNFGESQLPENTIMFQSTTADSDMITNVTDSCGVITIKINQKHSLVGLNPATKTLKELRIDSIRTVQWRPKIHQFRIEAEVSNSAHIIPAENSC